MQLKRPHKHTLGENCSKERYSGCTLLYCKVCKPWLMERHVESENLYCLTWVKHGAALKQKGSHQLRLTKRPGAPLSGYVFLILVTGVDTHTHLEMAHPMP